MVSGGEKKLVHGKEKASYDKGSLLMRLPLSYMYRICLTWRVLDK